MKKIFILATLSIFMLSSCTTTKSDKAFFIESEPVMEKDGFSYYGTNSFDMLFVIGLPDYFRPVTIGNKAIKIRTSNGMKEIPIMGFFTDAQKGIVIAAKKYKKKSAAEWKKFLGERIASEHQIYSAFKKNDFSFHVDWDFSSYSRDAQTDYQFVCKDDMLVVFAFSNMQGNKLTREEDKKSTGTIIYCALKTYFPNADSIKKNIPQKNSKTKQVFRRVCEGFLDGLAEHVYRNGGAVDVRSPNPGTFAPGVYQNKYGMPVRYEVENGVPGEMLQIKHDAYGPGIGMDQYGRPVKTVPAY